jgi:hypothetical protein
LWSFKILSSSRRISTKPGQRPIKKKLEAKIEANHEDMAEQKIQIGCLASRIDVNDEKVKVFHQEMKARQEKTRGRNALLPV